MESPEAHLVPVQPLQVHQNPHQLGDGQGGVGVIELDGHLLGVGGSQGLSLAPNLCPFRGPSKGPAGSGAELEVETLVAAAVGQEQQGSPGPMPVD